MDATSTTPPPEAALLHSFLNTLDLRTFIRYGIQLHGADRLSTPQALAAWLHTQDLLPADSPVSARDLARARGLRAQLRAALSRDEEPEAADGGSPQGIRLSFRLSGVPGEPPGLVPAGADAEGALGRLALCASRAVASGVWGRLKMCEAPDCHWVFYDKSRPGRGRWCSAELCGNRMKTRAYRRRHR
ncbi:CGNR zinc finger domain-containing protein [Streptomyces pinistramenti]|uniref:CGNR zinc finger domain-containing protein n=1 Tax=Streptomyces pinistramenti TaxID=2884812 RepID=UPI001D06C0F7|nr:CGNR zinc finger domain-containing protein [Streptomyces pinistramenti]MCB5911921.1 CGNR zinc finger domain-containing protein [Streptomyces pinistramenti]